MVITEQSLEASVDRLVAAMPKAELHLHLDGCLRPQTVVELAAVQDVPLPVPAERIADVLVAPPSCRDLVEVLSYFSLPTQVLQTAAALERVTYELCEDVRRENVRYVEIRFAPALHTARGLSLHNVIDAVTRGWEAGRHSFGLAGGVILCAMRHQPPAVTMEVARAGVPFLGQGVIAFDLAGDEANYPVLLHQEPLLWAKNAGYGMTVHAGEAAGAQSVRDAVEVIGVSRIGHGTRSDEDASLLSLLRDRSIALDMCPTSNVHTKVVPTIASHPIARYYHAGIPVTINSDNRTVSDTTVSRELRLTHDFLGLSLSDLARITLTAIDVGFAADGERRALREECHGRMVALGLLGDDGA